MKTFNGRFMATETDIHSRLLNFAITIRQARGHAGERTDYRQTSKIGMHLLIVINMH